MGAEPSSGARHEHPDPPSSGRVREARGRLLARIDKLSRGGAADAAEVDDTSRRYIVGEVIASGGFGIIHRSYDRRLRREVALKVSRTSSPADQQRLLLEAALTARLEHPGIIPIHDVGRLTGGKSFYCMSLLEGGALSDAIDARSNLQGRLYLLEQVLSVADAVAYAHRRGIIHRDLKPANILLGGQGQAVIIDWGLAKICDESAEEKLKAPCEDGATGGLETERGAVLGTLQYMAPEQARGETIDAQADVFALGALLFHVLAGRPPYVGAERSELLRRIRAGERDDLRDLVPEVPRDLAAIVSRALAPKRGDRYADAEGAAADLRSFLTGHVVEAHTYHFGELVRLWVRRNRVAAQVCAFASAVLLIAGFTFIHALRGETERAREAEAAALALGELAQSRTEAAILARARSLLDDDPSEALALLRQVSVETEEELGRARHVAIAAASRDRPTQVLEGHRATIRSITAISDGGLASVDASGSVWTWDLETGHGEEILDLGAPDGVVVAAADVSTWAALSDEVGFVFRDSGMPEVLDIGLLRGIGGRVEATFARDGGRLLVSSRTGGVHAQPGLRVWDLRGPVATLQLAVDGQPHSALSPSGETIAVVSRDDGAALITWGQRTLLPRTLRPQAFSGDGEYLVGSHHGDLKTAVYVPRSGALETFDDRVVTPVEGDSVLVHGLARAPLPLSSDYRLALRSLRTGEERWSLPLHEFVNRDVVRSLWGLGQRLAIDERGRRLALGLAGAWRIYSLLDGTLIQRLDVEPSIGTFSSHGVFVDADGDKLRVWRAPAGAEPAESSLLAVAADGSATLRREWGGGPLQLDQGVGGPSPFEASGCDDTPLRRALVNGRGDAVIVTKRGYCIVSSGSFGRRVDTEVKVSAAALASSAAAYAIGRDDGVVELVGAGGGPSRAVQLPEKVVGLWIDSAGASTYAATQRGAVFRIQGSGRPLLLEEGGDRSHSLIGAALHPSQDIVAIVAPSRARVLIHDGDRRAYARLDPPLSDVPAAAYSRSGRLALATADESVTILEPDAAARQTLRLHTVVTGFAFADEKTLIAVTSDGSLIRVDLALGDWITLRDAWIRPSSGATALSIRSDGAIFGLRVFESAFLPPNHVPAERGAFARWLVTTNRPHRGS